MTIIQDCIYGHIEIPDLCLKFMDVPEFQRLRRIRQLGMSHYVYPSANHTRFEHSLGVMHLAGKMVDQLRKIVKISERTKHLIQLAGMYHDIGHLAYSHLFDQFLHGFYEQNKESPSDHVFHLKEHELRSVFFLKRVNSRLQELTEPEQTFVENVISGKIPKGESAFLYQIICNAECGLDVDKLDYLWRDAYHTGLSDFKSDYIIYNCGLDRYFHLAFREKVRKDLQDVFSTRHRMHEKIYRHHTTQKLEKLYICCMKRLGSELFKYGIETDDYSLEGLIRNSSNPDIQKLVRKIDQRDLEHDCDQCSEYVLGSPITQSGSVEKARFIK